MYQNCLKKSHRRNLNLFGWHQGFPRNLKKLTNSAFLYKLAQAYVCRKLVFKEAILEEHVFAIRHQRLSKSALLVQFTIRLYQQISGNNKGVEILDEVFVTCVCNLVQRENTVRFIVIDAVNGDCLRDLKVKAFERNVDIKSYYFFRVERYDPTRLRVFLTGYLFAKHLFADSLGVWEHKIMHFTSKKSMLEIDSITGWAHRLS